MDQNIKSVILNLLVLFASLLFLCAAVVCFVLFFIKNSPYLFEGLVLLGLSITTYFSLSMILSQVALIKVNTEVIKNQATIIEQMGAFISATEKKSDTGFTQWGNITTTNLNPDGTLDVKTFDNLQDFANFTYTLQFPQGMGIPDIDLFEVMSIEQLNDELEKSLKEENYERAAQIREEIKKRDSQ